MIKDLDYPDTNDIKETAKIFEGDDLLKYNNLIIFNNFTKDRKWEWNVDVIFPSEKRIELIDAYPDEGNTCILVKIWQFLALYCLRSQIGLIYSNWKLVYSRHGCVKSPRIVIMGYKHFSML